MCWRCLFCTARRRNGFAAVQDLVTKTRVVSRTALESRPVLSTAEIPPPAVDDKSMVGPYHVLETMEANAGGQWLLGLRPPPVAQGVDPHGAARHSARCRSVAEHRPGGPLALACRATLAAGELGCVRRRGRPAAAAPDRKPPAVAPGAVLALRSGQGNQHGGERTARCPRCWRWIACGSPPTAGPSCSTFPRRALPRPASLKPLPHPPRRPCRKREEHNAFSAKSPWPRWKAGRDAAAATPKTAG